MPESEKKHVFQFFLLHLATQLMLMIILRISLKRSVSYISKAGDQQNRVSRIDPTLMGMSV